MGRNLTFEVIVIENGSTDNTSTVVNRLMGDVPQLTLINLEERGKGLAVRAGVLAARGRYIFLCDADISTPVSEIPRFLRRLEEGYDIVAGSREGVGAIRFGEPQYRHLMGRVFNYIVRMLAVPHIQDTQCGFKAFRRTAARELFAMQTVTGWAFDVEILYLARKYGFRVAELPVEWRFNADTKVSPLRDTRAMLRDIIAIRLRDLRGQYAVRRHHVQR
jgi:dolichyl-phosphate beta-glucosyltransferase